MINKWIIYAVCIIALSVSCNPQSSDSSAGPYEQRFDSLVNTIVDPNSEANKAWNNPQRDEVFEQVLAFFGEPVPPAIGRRLVDYGNSKYYIGAAKLTNPEVNIPVDEIVKKIFPQEEGFDYENYGLRVYPVLITKDGIPSLAYAICLSTNYDKDAEAAYFIVEKIGTGYEFKPSNKGLVLMAFNNFVSTVKIDGTTRAPGDPVYRSSRYFDWNGLAAYLEANDYTYPNPAFTIKLSYGYTTEADAIELYKIYYKRVADKAENLRGFTVVWELFKGGTSVVPEVPVPLGFKQSLIEIGNPCPPRCKGEGLF